jgi:hypothetical protein
MAAHSPLTLVVPPVPPDQPPAAWASWLREIAEAVNLLGSRANSMPPAAANDAAAAAAGVAIGGLYRVGSALMVRVV